MAGVTLDELCKKIPSKFSLVMVAAKRARQIKDGAPRLVPTLSVNPVTIAMEEIVQGKIILEGSHARVIDDFPRALSAKKSVDEVLAVPIDEFGDLDLLSEMSLDMKDEGPAAQRLLDALLGGIPDDEESERAGQNRDFAGKGKSGK